jgi:DNA repair ATPase RecN
MTRRYLRRIEDSEEQRTDVSKHNGKSDPELEFFQTLEANERTLTFGKKPKPSTGIKALKEETRWALDAAGNTGQYLKYFNMKLEKQNSQIKNIKKMKEKYDLQIKNLQSKIQDQQVQLDKVNKDLHKTLSSKDKKNDYKKH